MSRYRLGVLQTLSSCLIWGLFPLYWATLSEVDSLYILASRIAWSGVFFLLLILLKRMLPAVRAAFSSRRTVLLLLASGFIISFNWGTYIYAVNSGHVLDSSLAYYLNPLISVAMGALFFQERLAVRQWCAVALALCGVLSVTLLYRTSPFIIFSLSLSFALYGLLKKKVSVDPLVSNFVENLFVWPLALLFLLYARQAGFSGFQVLEGLRHPLLPLAGVVTAVPLLLYSAGVQKIPLSVSGMMLYLNPTMQMLLGVFLFRETLSLPRLLMFLLVWTALLLFFVHPRKKAAAPTPPNVPPAGTTDSDAPLVSPRP